MINNTSFHLGHEALTRRLYEDDFSLPSRYVFVITLACNLHCSFFPQETRRKKTLAPDEWYRIISQLPEYARVTVTGGEPFLYKGWEQILSRLAEKHDVNIITNGTLLTREKIDFLLTLERFKVLSISIDMPGNHNRGYTAEQWRALVDGATYFVDRKMQLGHNALLDVKTVVCEENAAHLNEVYVLCRDILRVDSIAFQFLKGSPLQHAASMYPLEEAFVPSKAPTLSPNGFKIVEEQLGMIHAAAGNKTGCRTYLHPPLVGNFGGEGGLPSLVGLYNASTFEHKSPLYANCMFPWSSAHINPDGEIFPCLAISLGNAARTSLRDLVADRPMQEFRRIIKREGLVQACNRCGWLRLKPV